MSWQAETVADTYRDAETSTSLAIVANGVTTTYADCQVTERTDTRVLENSVRAVVRYLVVHIPATAGVTAPPENSTFTWNAKSYTTSAPATGHGFFRVEAS